MSRDGCVALPRGAIGLSAVFLIILTYYFVTGRAGKGRQTGRNILPFELTALMVQINHILSITDQFGTF